MNRVAVVILNYMNYQETITCVNSVLNQQDIDLKIVVVDNGSENESYTVLKQQFATNKLIHVIRANKNYGFAKGNNIGIQYARDRFRSQFILLINSDTELIDDNYISILISKYQNQVGVIGSTIILRNGKSQKPYFEYVTFPETLFYYFDFWNQVYGISGLKRYIERALKKNKRVPILHGSAFMLTPAYFQKYDGLYDKTFLYAEEILLYIMCKRADLRQIYTNETSIYHKEDQSSKFLFSNRNSIKLKYVVKSYKYVVWESFKDYIFTNIISNRKGEHK